MRKIEISSLYDTDYSIQIINTLTQNWKPTRTFHCIGQPKQCDMLLYLHNCEAVYTLKSGEKIYAAAGSVVYAPLHAEYSLEIRTASGEPSMTTHINFLLSDAEHSPFVLSEKVEVFSADNANYKSIFNKIDHYGSANLVCHGKMKSIMYDLLFQLSQYYFKSHLRKYAMIERGIAYLEQDQEQALSVAEIAALCNVSEVYFRKLFKEYSGVSPAEYRTAAKICKAKNYLTQEGLSIADISDRLGFGEVSYFIKVFRQRVGVTPAKYRANYDNKK